jgi:hypothetical protein
MGDQGRWFKLWTTAPADPHLGNLSLEDFARWCLFGVYMKVHGTDGIVTVEPPMTALQQLFRVGACEDVFDIIRKFPHCALQPVTNSPVTYSVEWKNWLKYQGDFSGDRVKRWREKKRHAVTPKKRREEKREEENTTQGTPLRGVLPDAQFLENLRKNPAYQKVNFDQELSKLDAWLTTPRGRGKKKTRGRIVAWMNRALEEQPVKSGGFRGISL